MIKLTPEMIAKICNLLNDNDYLIRFQQHDTTDEEEFWKRLDPNYYESIKHTFGMELWCEMVPTKHFIENGYYFEYCAHHCMRDANIPYAEVDEGSVEVHISEDEVRTLLRNADINTITFEEMDKILSDNGIPYKTAELFYYNREEVA